MKVVRLQGRFEASDYFSQILACFILQRDLVTIRQLVQ